jgi:TolB protein
MVYPTEANFPAWSWDGQQMAFAARNGSVHDLIVRPASSPTPLTVAQDVVEDRPAWKPDNSEIAFSKLVEGQPYIFTVSASGGAVTQVSHVPGTHPQWSPDGSKIAFVSSFGGTTGVWILFMDQGPEPLDGWLTTSGEDWPTWRPGSGNLCYTVTTSTDCRTVWMAQNYPF